MVIGGIRTGSISGVVYVDDDYSGTRDEGERVVPSLAVTLLDAAGNTVATTKTNARGSYSFDEVAPGRYQLAMTARGGYAFTHLGEGNVIINLGDSKGATGFFSLGIGETLSEMNAGLVIPSSVKGCVYADHNDNGVIDMDEGGLTSVLVLLTNAETETVLRARVQEDASFTFDAVMPGAYSVTYQLPEHGVFVPMADDDALTWSEDGLTATTAVFELGVNETYQLDDIGAMTLIPFSGMVFDDSNGNGVRDEGERPLGGVSILVEGAGGTQHAVTGDDGCYELEALRPGSYTVTIEYPEGYMTSGTAGSSFPLTAGYTEEEFTLTLTCNDHYDAQVLAALHPATIAGHAWLDDNSNGRYDLGESVPVGETIALVDEDGRTLELLVIDANGYFACDSLMPGTYGLAYTPDADTEPAAEGDSTFSMADGKLVMNGITVSSGEVSNTAMLGLVRYTSVGGSVWVDRGNGAEALPGAVIRLLDTDGRAISEMTSDGSGAYHFHRLLPGTYMLDVTLPEGQVMIEPDDERLSAAQSSVMDVCVQRYGKTRPFALRMDQPLTTMNIGAVVPGQLGDFCWLDLNGNGLMDTGEYGIPGLRLRLMQGERVIAETTTDQYGFYRFTDLYPAVYTLRVELPDTLEPTIPNDQYPLVGSKLLSSGESVPVEVTSGRVNSEADLGFVLVDENVYPDGYGALPVMKWSDK